MLPKQGFSSLQSIRFSCGVRGTRSHPQATPLEPSQPTRQGFWAQPQPRTTFKVQLPRFTGTEPTVQWARTYIRTARNHLHLGLLLTQIPLYHGHPSRAELEPEDHKADSFTALEKPAKDRAIMRKEGANEKWINPNLPFPLAARNVKFHQLHVWKLIWKWPFHRKIIQLEQWPKYSPFIMYKDIRSSVRYKRGKCYLLQRSCGHYPNTSKKVTLYDVQLFLKWNKSLDRSPGKAESRSVLSSLFIDTSYWPQELNKHLLNETFGWKRKSVYGH